MGLSRRELVYGLAASSLALPRSTKAASHGGYQGTLLESIVGFIPSNFNMMPWSKFAQASDFTNAQFGTFESSISTGILSPSGVFNAQKLVEDTANGQHSVYSVYPAMTTNSNIVYRVAAIAKPSGRTRIVLFGESQTLETTVTASVGFDLAGGNVGYDVANGSAATVVGYGMTAIGGGWYLCYFDYNYTGTPGLGSVIQPKIKLDNGSGTAARSIAYVGDGSSGVSLWWFNLLPVGAWGTWTKQFSDDFTSLSTIDLGNTLNPGYNWYINNSAPNSINPAWWASLPVSLARNFTISSPSVLKIWDPTNNAQTWTSMMYTVCFPIGGGYVGQVWKAPVLFDGLFSWDNMSPYDFGGVLGPAFWCHTVEAMSGAASPTDHWMEWDWEDIGAEISGVSDHWMDAGVPQGAGIGAGWPQHLLMQAGEYHRISGLYLTIASNGGWGIFMSFFDGQFIAYTDVLYTSSTNLPALTNPNAGLFSAFESLHLPIMIDTGNRTSGVGNSGGWPMYIDWVKVYTK